MAICKKCRNYNCHYYEWCKPCLLRYLRKNFKNWTSGNGKIDNLIREMQLKVDSFDHAIFEWIPYSQFDDIKGNSMNRLCLAIWKDGPLRYEFTENKYIRKKNINIALKYISKSHNIADEVKFYNSDIFGISQNPDTNGYALVLDNVYCIKCGRKFTSYAKCSTCKIRYSWDQKINNIIQKIRFELDSYDKFEWIPYEQFYNIKEIDKSSSAYSALCKDGPYHRDININKYIRIRNVKVVLKYIDLHYIICEYNWIKNRSDRKIYGISQNKSDYILVFEGKYCEYCELPTTYSECEPCQMNYIKKNFTYCIDKNKKIGNLIREMHLKNDYSGIVFEWIPYDQFNNIKEMDECDFTSKIYSAVWKNGPSYYIGKNKYVRNLNQNKSITLKNLCDPQNNIDEILNEIKNYSDCEVYGISQDSDTKDYIMVLEAGYCDKCGLYTYGRWCKLCRINYFNKNFTVHADENEKIDYLIKKMQLKSDYDGIVFEWIPYSLFNNIEEIIKSDFTEIYSAVWKKGPSYYGNQIKYIRNKNKNKRVTFKKVYNLQDIALNEAKDYSNCKLYGISQDPSTKEYFIIFQDEYCEKCSRKYINVNMKLCPICQYSGNEFSNIKKVGEGGFAKVYSAIWTNGPLYYNNSYNEYIRTQNKKVALKCLHNSQNISNKFLNEVKGYSTKKYGSYINNNVLKIYGISQNPITKDYIMILDYAEGGNFDHWANKNYKNFDWSYKLTTLWNIIKGLKEIHQNQMVHRDFHTGNILLNAIYVNSLNDNSVYISDMGLCGKVNDINQNNIYGVMPYVAPEILKGKLYTQAADIYSFDNRPKIAEILELIDLFFYSYKYDKFAFKRIVKVKKEQQHYEIEKQFKEAEKYRKSHLTPFDESKRLTTHPQAFYTSRLLNPFTKDLPKDDNIGNNSVEVIDFTNDE
ncbi:uncharacterized protein OCT59_025275 [Rhizophagus irregularis]|uniref:uncharacterized protein n=1 Tax=Rhizophagus irregularis TaxID=588596 RepID=UPI00331FD949|nr:hypothetical protein OCT59_025275 [Rhizophagus irregularis]